MHHNISASLRSLRLGRRRGNAQLISTLTLMLVAVFVLAGCGSASTGSTSGPPAAQGSPTAGAAEGGDTTNGEAPTSTYTNSRFKYRVDTPGSMSEAADGSAYIGPAERLEIKVVKDASAADPHRLATDDLSLLTTKPAFKLIDSLSRVSLSGRGVEKVVFSWTDGVSAVTGKPNDLVSARYYIAKDSSNLAVVTYSIAANQYDPQGADDVASTFNWL